MLSEPLLVVAQLVRALDNLGILYVMGGSLEALGAQPVHKVALWSGVSVSAPVSGRITRRRAGPTQMPAYWEVPSKPVRVAADLARRGTEDFFQSPKCQRGSD